jgi:hypothetical protein
MFWPFGLLFGGLTFSTEGLLLLFPVPSLYWRKPIVKDSLKVVCACDEEGGGRM